MTKTQKDLMKVSDFGGFLPNRFHDLFSNFNKLMDEVWDRDWRVSAELQPKTSFPKVNVAETDTAYEVEVALAGFTKEDVELELKENCLYIKAEHNEDSSKEDKKYLVKEIAHRSFRRCLQFPSKIDTEDVSSSYSEGVLTINLGKAEIIKPDAVKISID